MQATDAAEIRVVLLISGAFWEHFEHDIFPQKRGLMDHSEEKPLCDG
jgi:hypothetical protein